MYPIRRKRSWNVIISALELLCVIYLLFFGLVRLTEAGERHDITVGTRLDFLVKRFDRNYFDFSQKDYEEVKATCQRVGKHCYVFVDDRFQVSHEQLSMTMIQWDYTIYPTVRTNFGIEWTPGVDGDYRIYILLTDLRDRMDSYHVVEKTKGYYTFYDEYTESEINWFNLEHGTKLETNEKEIIFMDLEALEVGSTEFLALLTRLYQRMVHYYQSTFGFENPRMEDEWVVAGCSCLAQYLCNYGVPEEFKAFLKDPEVELPEEELEVSDARIGGSFLLMLYLWEQFDGAIVMRDITASPSAGFEGIGEALSNRRDVLDRAYEDTSELGEFDLEIIRKAFRYGYNTLDQFEKIFLSRLLIKSIYMDWLVALVLDDTALEDGRYGFSAIDITDLKVPMYSMFPREFEDQDIVSFAGRFYGFRGTATNTLKYRMITASATDDLRVRLVKKSTSESTVVSTINVINGWATGRVDDFGETYPEAYWIVGKVTGDDMHSRYYIKSYLSGPVVAAFLSPIYKNMIIVDVLASELPVVSLYQEGMSGPVDLDIMQSPHGAYTGFYTMNPSLVGKGEISVRGRGPDHVHDEIIIPFDYLPEQPGSMELGSVSGVFLTLKNTTAGDGSAVLLVTEQDGDDELEALSPVAQVLARERQFATPGRLTLPLQKKSMSALTSLSPPAGLFLHDRESGWQFEQTVSLPADADRVAVPISRPGSYALLSDRVNPRLSCRQTASAADGSVTVAGEAYDGGSGIDWNSLSVWAGGEQVPANVTSGGAAQYEAMVNVDGLNGKTVQIKVADRCGNTASRSLEIKQGAAALSSVTMKAYPCPAAQQVTISLTVQGGLGAQATIRCTVHDVAGDTVIALSRNDFTDQPGDIFEYAWDLQSDLVSNGVYLYNVTIDEDGNSWNGKGKIVVLK